MQVVGHFYIYTLLHGKMKIKKRPEDVRHLTLLSADLKLMSRILANCISPWLTSILYPSQHCGIYGHNNFEAKATVREAIAYTECTRMSFVYYLLTSNKH